MDPMEGSSHSAPTKPSSSLTSSSVTSPEDDAISEKSARIRQWALRRLKELEEQNERLRQQNLRCTNELKALHSYAERNRHWRNSLLFSRSVTGTLPSRMDTNRTSDDSGLTSDETSGERHPHVPPHRNMSTSITAAGYSHRAHPKLTGTPSSSSASGNDGAADSNTLMTQSTSALLRRSPRNPRKPPMAAAHHHRKNASPAHRTQKSAGQDDHPSSKEPTAREEGCMGGAGCSATGNTSSTQSDSSAMDDRPKPVPTPRRIRNQPAMGNLVLVDRSNANAAASATANAAQPKVLTVERDSLNSYEVEDDYGEYEEEDEQFEEVEYDDSPVNEHLPADFRRRDPRYADYVNLSDFCRVQDADGSSSSMRHIYSDITRASSEQPELPVHKPFMQWEQRLYRTAERCLSVVDSIPARDSGSASCSSPVNSSDLATDTLIPTLSGVHFSGTLRRASPGQTSRASDGRSSTNKTASSRGNSSCYLPTRESDSGLGRGSGGQLAPLPETPPEGMVLTHPPSSQPQNGSAIFGGRLASQSPLRAGSAASSGKSAHDDTPALMGNRDYAMPPPSRLGSNDYAVPPDASNTATFPRVRLATGPSLRTSLIPAHDSLERSGNLIYMSESRLRSLKRRFVFLRNGQLEFYRAAKNQARGESPTMTVPLASIRSITRVSTKSGGQGFQISTDSENLRYQAETDKVTEEWFVTLSATLRNLTITEISQRSRPVDAMMSGFVTKVKHGHQKRYYASLIGQKLLFFKKPDDKIPASHVYLQGAHICEKTTSSSDEYSGSSDEQNIVEESSANGHAAEGFSVCVEVVNSDPLYLILRSAEEKDKWMYYLRLASRDPLLCGTPFEVLVQRLMDEPQPAQSALWNDVLLTVPEEKPTDSLTTIEEVAIRKKAVELDQACYLFTAVPMNPVAVQYHVDLSQNLLSNAMEHDALRNELYAQLIRLTNGQLPYRLQAWKLLALAVPLYLPKQYSLLWLLKSHVGRWAASNADESRMAAFCAQSLQKREKVGDRREGPSKLEAISILARDPCTTQLPFSVPILLPSGDYQVIEFDGSTEIGQCLSSLCIKLKLRPALLSGYALYANDPSGSDEDLILLKGKQKLCDCLTAWERRVKDAKLGRVTADSCSIRLQLRMRHHWTALAHEETEMEKAFLCHRMAEEVVAGHLPLSNEFAEELCALYAQMCYGDLPADPADSLFDTVLTRFYPAKMLEVVNERSLRDSVAQHWTQLEGLSMAECVRMILNVLRRWRFFGAYIECARMKMHSDRRIFVALNDQGVHLLTDKQLDVVRSFPYHQLLNFGEFHDDFMITVSRALPPDAHPEETPKERLTFTMRKKSIEQLTIHLAEYIRCQKLVWRVGGGTA